MEIVTVDGKLELTLPEGFHVMDESEKEDLELIAGGDYIAFTDPGKHITATIGWRDLGLAAILINASDAIRSAEKQIGDAMQRFKYEFTGFTSRSIAGKSSRGFDYIYTSKGIEMAGQTCVMKAGTRLYFLNVYYRCSLKEDSLRIWNMVLDSAVRK